MTIPLQFKLEMAGMTKVFTVVNPARGLRTV